MSRLVGTWFYILDSVKRKILVVLKFGSWGSKRDIFNLVMLNFGNLAVIQYIFHVYQQFTKILFWWSSSKRQTADWQHSLLYGSCAENKNIVTHWARNELYSFYISDRQDPNAMSYVGYLNQEWNAGSTGLGGCDWGGAVLDMVVTMLASLLQPIRW